MVSQDRSVKAERSPFGELLVRFRTEMGLTQAGLAQATTTVSISPRSITNYEKSTSDPRDWILPHRPTIRALSTALALSAEQRRQLTEAWDRSRQQKEASSVVDPQQSFTRAGREHVLQQLQNHWRIATTGIPQIVLVGAEAGMGKTSLASHFCDWVAANYHPVVVSWGESTNYGATTEPYIPVRYSTDRLLVPPIANFTIPGAYANRPHLSTDRVREILTFLPKLTGALLSDRTVTNLGKMHPDIPAENFRTILEQTVATEAIGRWDEYARLLHSLSQDWPLLIVLEDLHWAGDLTASLLCHLLHNLARATRTPVMILGTVRSEEIEHQPSGQPSQLSTLIRDLVSNPIGSYVSMADTLSPVHGREFIRALVRAYPMVYEAHETGVVEFLYSHTAGQPLLTMEMLHHLQESGALTQQLPMNLWLFDASAIKEGVPSAISSFIKQRLERVPRRGKALLEVSAVMGEWMLPEVVAQVLGLDEDETIEFIDDGLVDTHHLLQPSPDVLMDQRHYRAYRFSHALVRDYVYSTIPQTRKRSLHVRLAETLETMSDSFDMTAMGAVANHYAQAEDWYGAEMAAYHTAQIAVGRMAWDLGEFWFDQAEDLAVKARDPRQLWRSRAARLAMLRGQGHYEQGVELGNRILRQVTHHDWPMVEALALHHLGEIQLDLGNLEDSTSLLIRARDIYLQLDHIELAVAAASMLSHTTYRQGHFDIAREHANMALELGRSLPISWVRSEALLAAANCEIDLGFYEEAMAGYQAAVDLAKTLGKLNNETIPQMNIGLILTFTGRHDEAIAYLNALIEQIEDHAPVRHAGFPLFYVGMAYEAKGDLKNARAAYQRATDVRDSRPQIPTQFDSIGGLLRIAVTEGDLETVRRRLEELEEFIAEHTWRGMEYPLLVLVSMADAYRLLGNEQRHVELIHEAHDELVRRASLISDASARESYLTRVAMNVGVLQRYERLSPD